MLAHRQPTGHARGDDEERRRAALHQNANQDLDQDGEQECDQRAQQQIPPAIVHQTQAETLSMSADFLE